MEKHLNCVVLLPLEEIVLRKVIVMLWKQIDILALFEVDTYIFSCDRDENLGMQLNEAQHMIESRISKLMLSELLLKKAICLLKPVGLEIKKWTALHSDLLIDPVPGEYDTDDSMFEFQYNSNLDRRVLEKLCFTSLGTVDHKKTAEELICHNMLDIVQRYKLACYYCLDADIPHLWGNMAEESKKRFYDEEKLRNGKLEFCFPYILNGEKAKLDLMFEDRSFYQWAFQISALNHNVAATQYFYEKLTFEEKESLLCETARNAVYEILLIVNDTPYRLPVGNFSGTLHYLLSQMSHEQQMELFKECPGKILSCFLQWPWHNLLLDIAELTWGFLPDSFFHDLLCHLYKNVSILGYSYLNVFQKFFLRSPSNYKSFFINRECLQAKFFLNFFKFEDTETFGFILSNVDAGDKTRLVFSNEGLKICHKLITENKWNLLELFIQKAMLSEDGRKTLKIKFKRYVSANSKLEMKCTIQERKRFFELVDDFDKSVSGKRSLVKENPGTKKLCSEE